MVRNRFETSSRRSSSACRRAIAVTNIFHGIFSTAEHAETSSRGTLAPRVPRSVAPLAFRCDAVIRTPQEDQFHLEQAKLRSRIRIQDGRAKPIDLLAKYISAEEEVDAVEMHEPYTYLRGLHMKDLEDLIEDIKVYKELERGKNLDYWNDITVIVEDELHKLRKLERTEYEVGKRNDSFFSFVFIVLLYACITS